MRRVLMAAMAAAATVGFASPALAADANCPTCTVADDPTGTPLDWPIYGDPKRQNDNVLVYGSAPNNDTADNVQFVGNSLLNISDGFAHVSDSTTDGAGNLFWLIINPDDAFDIFEFATQLEQESGTVYVYYLLSGSGLDASNISSYQAAVCGTYCGIAGSYASGDKDKKNYLLTGGNFDGFVLSSAETFSFFQAKQLSYNQVGRTPSVPEPATWGLMLLGFGGIGMALRRSRRRGKQALMQIA